MSRISVLLSDADEARFCSYCDEKGFKKSTLIARLIREHLDREGYAAQARLFGDHDRVERNASAPRRRPRR